jgi:hypothetical protein
MSVKENHTYIGVSNWFEGEPLVKADNEGMLNIWPVGGTGPYLSMSFKRWRELATAVDVAIGELRLPSQCEIHNVPRIFDELDLSMFCPQCVKVDV